MRVGGWLRWFLPINRESTFSKFMAHLPAAGGRMGEV